MSIGTIKLWNSDRGFGFISNDDGSGDTFVQVTVLERAGYGAVAIGQRVEFERGKNPKNNRDCAISVELLPPVILPPTMAEQEHAAHMALAETAFMKSPPA